MYTTGLPSSGEVVGAREQHRAHRHPAAPPAARISARYGPGGGAEPVVPYAGGAIGCGGAS
jgi:hypothetical protein